MFKKIYINVASIAEKIHIAMYFYIPVLRQFEYEYLRICLWICSMTCIFIFCLFHLRFYQYYHFRCTTVRGVLENYRNVNSTLLWATLYGFKFHQSPYVTIECTVRICDPNSKCANETKVNVYTSTNIENQICTVRKWY